MYCCYLASVVLLTAVSHPAAAEDFKQENTAGNLKKMMLLLHKTLTKDRDLDTAKKLLGGLFLDEARLKLALKDDVPENAIMAILNRHKEMAGADQRGFCSPERSEVQVHGATTEEIIAYKEGSVAFNKFPGGAREMARKILKPGMTFYEVEFVVPGQDKGMKYHLFFWDGKQWAMLGAAWRVVK